MSVERCVSRLAVQMNNIYPTKSTSKSIFLMILASISIVRTMYPSNWTTSSIKQTVLDSGVWSKSMTALGHSRKHVALGIVPKFGRGAVFGT